MTLLRNLGLRASVTVYVVLAVTGLLALGAMSFNNMHQSEKLARQVLATVTQTRAAGGVDMMHDALRGDVLAAQALGGAAPDERRASLLADVARHVKLMQDDLSVLESTASHPGVQDALRQARPAVTTYSAAAAALAEAALAGRSDARLQATFDQGFAELEQRLAALSDLTEKAAANDVERQAAAYAKARWQTALGSAGTPPIRTAEAALPA